jgi:hypothetical protein
LLFDFSRAILFLAFLRGLEKVPTFLVPIINPPFADNSPHYPPEAGSDLSIRHPELAFFKKTSLIVILSN